MFLHATECDQTLFYYSTLRSFFILYQNLIMCQLFSSVQSCHFSGSHSSIVANMLDYHPGGHNQIMSLSSCWGELIKIQFTWAPGYQIKHPGNMKETSMSTKCWLVYKTMDASTIFQYISDVDRVRELELKCLYVYHD